MVTINHDWGSSVTEQLLEMEVRDYMNVCYSGQSLSPTQIKEIRQAFISGIHWLNTQGGYYSDELQEACRKLVGLDSLSNL